MFGGSDWAVVLGEGGMLGRGGASPVAGPIGGVSVHAWGGGGTG